MVKGGAAKKARRSTMYAVVTWTDHEGPEAMTLFLSRRGALRAHDGLPGSTVHGPVAPGKAVDFAFSIPTTPSWDDRAR